MHEGFSIFPFYHFQDAGGYDSPILVGKAGNRKQEQKFQVKNRVKEF